MLLIDGIALHNRSCPSPYALWLLFFICPGPASPIAFTGQIASGTRPKNYVVTTMNTANVGLNVRLTMEDGNAYTWFFNSLW
jgi:hypothetical protein